MKSRKLSGLIAATYTPFDRHGAVNVQAVGPLVEHLLESGITGLYICGSTGEGMSLTSDERRSVTEAFVEATDRRVPVVVQVGHNSLWEARQLAEHAQRVGADVISATCPSYYQVSDAESLVDCMASVANAAPDLPFYYYHIPSLTGSTLDVVEFLKRGSDRIPSLLGLKYTDTKLYEFQQCLELDEGRFDVVWGCDEMLLAALATGTLAAIGSTYNIAAPLYRQLTMAFTVGDLSEARRLQSLSVNIIRIMNRFPFHPAMKAVLGMQGFNVGGCRLPLGSLSDTDADALQRELEVIGFFEWSRPAATGSKS